MSSSRHSISVALLAGALLTSVPMVFAGRSYDTMQKDIATYMDVLTQEIYEANIEAGEILHDSVTDLFADTQSGATRQVEVQADPFVTFRENGVLYALKDVPRQAWFAPYVRDIVERKIAGGYRTPDGIPTGMFGPANDVAVDELAKMAVVSTGLDYNLCTGSAKNPMAETGSWARPFVVCAEKLGWAVYSDGTANLRRSATRAEVIMTLLQAFDVPLKQISGSGVIFSDVGSSTQFAPAIYTAALDGIVGGYEDVSGAKPLFGPAKPINRAEVAKMLSVALQLYK